MTTPGDSKYLLETSVVLRQLDQNGAWTASALEFRDHIRIDGLELNRAASLMLRLHDHTRALKEEFTDDVNLP